MQNNNLTSPETDSDTSSLFQDDTSGTREEYGSSVNPFLVWLNIISNPVNGWKRLKNGKAGNGFMARGLFVPLLVTVFLAHFMERFYNSQAEISTIVVNGLIFAVSIALSYFAVPALISLIMGPAVSIKINSQFGRNYIMCCLSTLVGGYIVYLLLPMFAPLLAFVPLLAIYLALKGARFLRIDEAKLNRFRFFIAVSIIAVPYGINEIFSAI